MEQVGSKIKSNPFPDSTNRLNPLSAKLLNRLRLSFRHLYERKCRHNFRDTFNPLCLCNTETETTSHYLLHYPLFSEQRTNSLKVPVILTNLY